MRARSRENLPRMGSRPQRVSRHGPIRSCITSSPMKSMRETPCCKRPSPQTASAKRSRRIPASCRSITSRTTTLLSSRGTSTSGYRRRWHGGPASERFCRKAEKQNRASIPPSMRSVSGWSVGSVVPPISGVPGPGTASNGSSGGASPGWNLGKILP